jgi:hypothetical protein
MMNKQILFWLIIILTIFLISLSLKNKDLNTLSLADKPKDNSSLIIPLTKKHSNINYNFSGNTSQELAEKEKEKTSVIKEYSYIKLYNMYKLAEDCAPLNERLKWLDGNIQDLFYLFNDYIKLESNNRQELITENQRESLNIFIDKCEKLSNLARWIQADQLPLITGSVVAIIKSQMQNTKALTEEEKILKKVLNLINDLKLSSKKIYQYSRGEQTLSQFELNAIAESMLEIEKKLNKLTLTHPNDLYETDEFNTLYDSLKEKEEYLKSQIEIDKTKIANEIEIFSSKLTLLSLHQHTGYSPVFREIYNYFLDIENTPDDFIFNNKYVTKQKPLLLINNIAQQLEFKDKHYFNQTYTAAIELYFCYLGADCSQNSRFIRNHCIGFFYSLYNLDRVNIYQESCDLSVDEFYFQFFISPNQLEDVERILKYLVQNYAN